MDRAALIVSLDYQRGAWRVRFTKRHVIRAAISPAIASAREMAPGSRLQRILSPAILTLSGAIEFSYRPACRGTPFRRTGMVSLSLSLAEARENGGKRGTAGWAGWV